MVSGEVNLGSAKDFMGLDEGVVFLAQQPPHDRQYGARDVKR